MGHSSPNQPLKVLLLARGGSMDGSQRQFCYLLRGMDRSRFEPLVLLDRDGPLTDSLMQCGVQARVMPLHPWRSFPTGLFRYLDGLKIARWGKQHGIGLLHVTDAWKSGYLHFVARRLNVPGILHVRGPLSPRDIRKLQLCRASAIIAIAQRYRDDLQAAGISSDRVEVIDDAVDLDRFRPNRAAGEEFLQKKFGVRGEATIGLVGRIEPFKRVTEFLEVVAPLARSATRRMKVLIVGQPKDDNYHRTVLETTNRLGLANHVTFTGRCNDMELIMAGLDILVTMSGGSTMFEAMACATPVLSVREDGLHSLHTRHNETAMCVTTAQAGPATAALAHLVDDPALRERLGRAGRAWVEAHLSPAALVDRTQALYARLTGK